MCRVVLGIVDRLLDALGRDIELVCLLCELIWLVAGDQVNQVNRLLIVIADADGHVMIQVCSHNISCNYITLTGYFK